MKIWSTPHSDMGRPVNYNGPKVINPVVVHRELPLGMVTCRCAAGYMLETPSIRRYFFGSDNPFGAGNQQERPDGAASANPGILRGHTPATSSTIEYR